jgi:hypothetical protein
MDLKWLPDGQSIRFVQCRVDLMRHPRFRNGKIPWLDFWLLVLHLHATERFGRGSGPSLEPPGLIGPETFPILYADRQPGIADNPRAYYYSQRRVTLYSAIYYRIETYLFEINFSGPTSHSFAPV